MKYTTSTATFSVDKFVLWVMLNPSTGDALRDDATIRRCVGFTSDLGYNRLCIVNLFAYRAKSPQSLLNPLDPIGPDNDMTILDQSYAANLVIAAWGNHGAMMHRARQLAMVALQQQFHWDSASAAKFFNRHCHGTALHAKKLISNLAQTDRGAQIIIAKFHRQLSIRRKQEDSLS